MLDIQSAYSKSSLKTLIEENIQISDGFLLWYPNYCFSCIFEQYLIKATKYFLIGYFADQKLNVFEKFNDIDYVVDMLSNIVRQRLGCNETHYNIQFLSCFCKFTKSQKNNVLRNHKSFAQKQLCARQKQEKYVNLECAEKDKLLKEKKEKYNITHKV